MSFMSFGRTQRPIAIKDYSEICSAATRLCEREGPHTIIENYLTYLAASVGDSVYSEIHGKPRITINSGQADLYQDTITALTGGPTYTVQDLPPTSTLGRLLSLTAEISYTPNDTPAINIIYDAFAENHKHTPFGSVIYPENWPRDCLFTPPPIAPLEAAFEMRQVVEDCAEAYNNDKDGSRSILATHALAYGLKRFNGIISPRQALHLVIPTIISVAHQSPITFSNRKEADFNTKLRFKRQQPSFAPQL